MENFRHVHVEDVSSSDESDPKRHMSDNSDSTPKKISNLKNVVLLLDCDVRKENGEVYLPDGTEMARLKKPEREQFKKNIKFTRTMTEENVEEELRRQFPILRNNGRLSCASAANRGTRLEFHYSPRIVWDGTKINKHIRGNSALYVLFERTPESVHERPESPPVDSSLQQLQTPTPKPMDSPLPCSSNLQRLKRKHDFSSSCVLEVVQNTGASVKKQVLEATSCPKGSKEGGQQSHQDQGDHSASPTTGLLCNSGLKQSSGEDHSKDSQEVSKVRRSVENNSSLDSAYESTSGDASGVDDNTEHLIGKTEEAASSHIRDLVDYLEDPQIDPTEGSSLDEISLHRVATGDQIFLSDREWNKIYQDTLGIPLFKSVIQEIIPKEGPITGGTKFAIFVNENGIPENLSSLRAIFEGVGFADLTPLNKSAYTGHSPVSKILGKVAVIVGSLDGSWNSPDETEFEYHSNIIQDLQELISKALHTKRNIPLDNQTLNPSRSARTVCSPSSLSSMVNRPLMADASEDILSLKALQCILFAAAATNDRECIEVIFSTSAGRAVFQTYRNSSILPEDIARARGHQNLSEYLQNVHKRLSEEIVCNVQTVTIDWVELERATAKKDICCTDESQGLDDDQSSYFADDETSICQSPSTSEFSNEDECIESKCYNQEGASPANDYNATSAVTTIVGETPNSSERGSEVGNNSSASSQMQGPIAGITKELLCGDNVESVAGPFIMMKTENTRRERNCGGKDQEQELNNLDKPPGQDDFKQQLCKKHPTVAMATGRSPIKVPCENEKENGPNFDEDTLRATADVYSDKGNEALERGDFINAIHFYTKGIKTNCNEKELKAKLYNNRAIAHSKLGNHQDSLRDAEAAIELNPTFLEAIVRGATACVELKKFEEAITWCNKGLAIDKNNRILLSLRLQSVSEVGDQSMEEKDPISHDHGSASSGDVKKVIDFNNQGDKHGKGNYYGNLGDLYLRQGDLKKAIECYNQDLKIAKEVGDEHEEGSTFGNLGNAYFHLGDYKKAIECHNLHLKIAKDIGDKQREGVALNNLGIAYNRTSDLKKSVECHNLHLKIAKELGDKHGEGAAFGNLGNAYKGLGDFKKAIKYHNLHLKKAKEVGNKHGEGNAYRNLGNAYHGVGDFNRAIEYHNLDLKITKEVGDKHGEGHAYGNLGIDYRSLGDFKKAIEYHNLDLKIAKEVGDKHGEGCAYGNLGNAYDDVGDFKKSVEYHNLHLKIAKELGDKHGEGGAYGNLGNAYEGLGDFKKAIEYHNLCLKIVKEVGDKHVEGKAYGNLGNAYQSLGDFKKAMEYHNLCLKIAKEVGDKHGEGQAYGNLGNAYQSLGDFKKAIEYHNLHLKITKEVGDKHGEGHAYGNLGNDYRSLGDFKKTIEYHNLGLTIAKEVGDKRGEGHAYGNLGIAYQSQGEFKKALEYHNLHLKIAQEVGDKHAEGNTFGNLGNDYYGLGEFKKAIEYHNLGLKIVKEIGDKHGEASAYGDLGNAYRYLGDLKKANELYCLLLKLAKEVEDQSLEAHAYYLLGCVFEAQGGLPKAVEHFRASVKLYNSLRVLLKSKDEWKVNFRNKHQNAYSDLCSVLVKQGNIDEALFAAEKGRAQALTDLMEFSFCGRTGQHKGSDEDLADLKKVPSDIIFQVVDEADVNLWFVSKGKQVQLRQSNLTDSVSENSGARQSFESFIHGVYTQIRVPFNVRCENRSLDALRGSRSKVDVKTKEDNPRPPIQQDERGLSTLYDTLMKPVADLLQGDELLIIPDGPLWLAPYAALKDGNSKYLCESFRIRLAPSLTSLRLISDCPDDYHKSSGALLVGDPSLAEVTNIKGEEIFEPLPCAKEEVEMIGEILNITPLTGRQATKREVLKRLSSVSLVHLAAHGCPETGEIALAPDPDRISPDLKEEDYILTIEDVLKVQLRAKLVVLSCCHSGRGEIKAEGVVGIARAFMGAGARSVVVSLWKIDDEATLEFMKYFYQHLAEGKPASESLNLAMKSLRESDEFCDIKYWAPFLLIGDDVTLDFMTRKRKLNHSSTGIPIKTHKFSSNQAE